MASDELVRRSALLLAPLQTAALVPARCAAARPARLAQAVVSSAVARLVVPVAECNAAAALVAAELDAAGPVEHTLAAAIELVAAPALEFALVQPAAAEHLPTAAQEPAGIVGLLQPVDLAARVSDLPAIAGRIDVERERR